MARALVIKRPMLADLQNGVCLDLLFSRLNQPGHRFCPRTQKHVVEVLALLGR